VPQFIKFGLIYRKEFDEKSISFSEFDVIAKINLPPSIYLNDCPLSDNMNFGWRQFLKRFMHKMQL